LAFRANSTTPADLDSEGLIEKCKRHGVVPGIQTRSVAMAKAWAERGMRFVGASAEHGLLLERPRSQSPLCVQRGRHSRHSAPAVRQVVFSTGA